ncbi:MAG: restriction endonuclease subunit S [Ignavibacteriaceae bacterium]|nr:restriction endonuclease subunit S [Ignavibacteriaceae bacterium]
MREGYSQTEFGNIPKEWRVKSLGDVGEVKMCKRVFNNQTKQSGPIPFYKIGTFGKEPDAFITEELFNNYRQKYYFPKKGDILISASGTIGRTVIYDGKPAYFQDSNIIWIDNNETIVSNSYLYYLYQVVDYRTEGQTIQRLYNDIIKITKFICPPTEEQTAIAQVLSDTDELISSLEKLIEKKKLIKQGTMQQLLTGKKRLPGFSGEWEVKKLGDVAEIRDGTHQTPVYVDDGIQFYSVENITENNFTNTKFISLEEHKRLTKTYKIEKGDILMTRIGSIGDCKLINWDVEASFYVSLALLKIKKGYSNKFIAHLIKSYDFQKEIELRSLQWAVPKKINLGAISAIDIKIPTDVTEQDAIAEVLNNIDSDIESLEQKLNKYKLIKQGMMQNLLTGKIRLV